MQLGAVATLLGHGDRRGVCVPLEARALSCPAEGAGSPAEIYGLLWILPHN